MSSYQYAIVGGGLQGGLLALALLRRGPLRLALVEQEQQLGGCRTWCFHPEGLPADTLGWLDPLLAARWPGYEVRFPGYRRVVEAPFAAATPELLEAEVRRRFAETPGSLLCTGCRAVQLEQHAVVLEDGRRLEAELVVDARGPDLERNAPAQAYRKLFGLEVELQRPSAFQLPVLLDATLPQQTGYRFLYLIPLGPRRLLIKQTCFSESMRLDRTALRHGILAHLEARGLKVAGTVREEAGVLPMPWRGGVRGQRQGPLPAGYRGGWFHPTTGDSLPQAVQLARLVALHAPSPPFGPGFDELQRQVAEQQRFAHLLNFLQLRLVAPRDRWRISARFFELPEQTIARFHALKTGWGDRARILGGQAPGTLRRTLLRQAERLLRR